MCLKRLLALMIFVLCLGANLRDSLAAPVLDNEMVALCASGGKAELEKAVKSGKLSIHAKSSEGYTPLEIAVAKNANGEAIESLLQKGADPNTVFNYTGKPLILWAMQMRQDGVQIAKFFLKYGVNPNTRVKDLNEKTNSSILHSAVFFANSEGKEINAQYNHLATALIRAGADVNAKDELGKTPLHWARNAETVRVLLDEGANLMAKDYQGRTPLHEKKFPDALRLLVKAGADINAQDNEGHTALHLRLILPDDDYPRTNPLETLLELGADPAIKNKQGKTPLDIARSKDHGERNVEMMLARKGGYLSKELRDLAETGKLEEVRKYIAKNPGFIKAVDDNGLTALHIAARFNSKNVVALLLSAGANVNLVDKYGATPLVFATFRDWPRNVEETAIVECLLLAGANVNAQTKSGVTALTNAVDHGNKETVAILVGKGARVDQKTFQIAAKTSNSEILLLLLDKGIASNVDVQADKSLKLAIQSNKDSGVASALLKFKANPHICDSKGLFPLHHAASVYIHDSPELRGFDIVRKLLAAGADSNDRIGFCKPPEAKGKESNKDEMGYGMSYFLARPPSREPSRNASLPRLGGTPLHLASDLNIVQALIQGKSDINAIDCNGMTPLDVALEGGKSKVAQMIANAGGVKGKQLKVDFQENRVSCLIQKEYWDKADTSEEIAQFLAQPQKTRQKKVTQLLSEFRRIGFSSDSNAMLYVVLSHELKGFFEIEATKKLIAIGHKNGKTLDQIVTEAPDSFWDEIRQKLK